MSISENKCLACSLERNCCQQIDNLRLTKSEFHRHFSNHADKFHIKDFGAWLLLNAKKDTACPHWQGQCSIYESRPVECQLYPHTIGEIVETGSHVKLTYHARTACPLKDELIAPQEESERAIRRFAEDAFGVDAKIIVRTETASELLLLLPRKVAKKVMRVCGTMPRSI